MKRVLRINYEHLFVVGQVGLYCGTSFKGRRRVTQVDPLSPTIFNIVVEEVILHWFILVAVEYAVPECYGQAFQWMASLFYADYGIIALYQPSHLQAALDVFMGLFDRFCLHTNINNILVVV